MPLVARLSRADRGNVRARAHRAPSYGADLAGRNREARTGVVPNLGSMYRLEPSDGLAASDN